MLEDLHAKASQECTIDFCFQGQAGGARENTRRDQLVAYLANPGVRTGEVIALALSAVTPGRSGLGLLFLVARRIGGRHSLLVARFPADQGVLAEERGGRLSVELVERVFMKSVNAYKAALLEGPNLADDYWTGRAVDKQISADRELSDYWIFNFLTGQWSSAPVAATRRFALAIKHAVDSSNSLDVQAELIAAVPTLARGEGVRSSGRDLLAGLNVSMEANEAVIAGYSRPELMDEVFEFVAEELWAQLPYRAVRTAANVVVIADARSFDSIVEFTAGTAAGQPAGIFVKGRVVAEKYRRKQ